MTAFVGLGVEKFRITGGQPSLRKDFLDIVRIVACYPSIKTIALTTNGFRLDKRIDSYFAAGINHLNISIDSLDPDVFYKSTGKKSLKNILAGIK